MITFVSRSLSTCHSRQREILSIIFDIGRVSVASSRGCDR
jgi:hypothetical protein